jgi:uncharacterized membrane protein YjjP (DUF1212 family)
MNTKEEFLEKLRSKNLTEDDIREIEEIITEGEDARTVELMNDRIALIVDAVNNFINGEGVKTVFDKISLIRKNNQDYSIEQQKIAKEYEFKKTNADKDNLQQSRTYLKFKYWQDIVMVALICTAIVILGTVGKINESSIGTLFGAIIGYALGRFKNKASEN